MKWKIFTQQKHEYEEEMTHPHSVFWSGHVNFVYDLIRNLKPATVVELGTHWGRSIFAMAQAVKDGKLENEIRLHAVDTWSGDNHTGGYGSEVFDYVNRISDKHYPELKINFHRKTFDEALDGFYPKSIDLLHIDGYHTFEAVKHDFETWISKVRSGGMVLFHDVAEYKVDFGAYKFWHELMKQKDKYSGFRFLHSHGLGVLFVDNKSDYGDLLDNALNFVDYYYEIGTIYRNKIEMQIKEKETLNHDRNMTENVPTVTQSLRLLKKSISSRIKNYI